MSSQVEPVSTSYKSPKINAKHRVTGPGSLESVGHDRRGRVATVPYSSTISIAQVMASYQRGILLYLLAWFEGTTPTGTRWTSFSTFLKDPVYALPLAQTSAKPGVAMSDVYRYSILGRRWYSSKIHPKFLICCLRSQLAN